MAMWNEMTLQEVGRADRLDAEHFRPDYVRNENLVCAWPTRLLSNVATSIARGMQPQYDEGGHVPVLRTVNVQNGHITETRQEFVAAEFWAKNPRAQVRQGDVLITSTGVGTLGRVTYNPHATPFFADGHITIVRGVHDYDPQFIALFLQSSVGLALIERRYRGSSGQIEIYPDDIGSIPIPKLGENVEVEIVELCRQSQHQRACSLELYAEAEALLLDALGLNNLSATHAIAYERNFEEVALAGRFDAQYYHPEKYEVLEALKPMSGESVGELFKSINHIVDAEDEFASEVQNYDLTDALQFFLPDIAPIPTAELGSNKKRFRRGDVVVSRLRSYLKEIALVEATSPACVGSTEFFVLRPSSERVSSELLLVYLRSEPVQKILRWCQDGSQHPRFKENELLSIKLPDRLLTVQDGVIAKVREAIQTFYDAQALLENAKRRVEKLIEGGG
jgi:type I restriction enzyme S subunit